LGDAKRFVCDAKRRRWVMFKAATAREWERLQQ
jgi:hypothetical protein